MSPIFSFVGKEAVELASQEQHAWQPLGRVVLQCTASSAVMVLRVWRKCLRSWKGQAGNQEWRVTAAHSDNSIKMYINLHMQLYMPVYVKVNMASSAGCEQIENQK